MSSLDSLINYTMISQDAELATAFRLLKDEPTKLTQFIQDQQNSVYNQIMQQKESTFDKVYGDLDRSAKVQESILLHNKRTGELKNMRDQIYQRQKQSADALLSDKQNATRKTEMNEWSVNNKRDTLFVFSSLFIMLSGFILLTGLWRLGMISSMLWVSLGTPLLIIFVLIVVRRSMYTENVRNKRFWSKKIFEGKSESIPSACELPSMDSAASLLSNTVQGTA
jgi:hypothetical protein